MIVITEADVSSLSSYV